MLSALAALRGSYAVGFATNHVGDSVEHDVAGAQAAGLRAIWLNRRGLPRPAGPVPDGEISSLADLPAAIEKLLSA